MFFVFFFVFQDSYVIYMCVMDIMNVLRTGMNVSISRIHIWLCNTFNHIISECSKLAQKVYKTRHDWVSKVIHWKMCKKFKFDHTNKWYMHNPASLLENNTHKLLCEFGIYTDHLISARRPDLIIINQKKTTCKIVNFAVPADHRIKLKECEKKYK